MKIRAIRAFQHESAGSAVTEFLIFTLPFFTAFLILTTSIASKSMMILESNNLARQAVRAFVTSPNEQLALTRAEQVIDIYQSKLSPASKIKRPIKLEIKCKNFPCFSPGNLITATITVAMSQSSSASEYIDLWR